MRYRPIFSSDYFTFYIIPIGNSKHELTSYLVDNFTSHKVCRLWILWSRSFFLFFFFPHRIFYAPKINRRGIIRQEFVLVNYLVHFANLFPQFTLKFFLLKYIKMCDNKRRFYKLFLDCSTSACLSSWYKDNTRVAEYYQMGDDIRSDSKYR